MAYADALIAAGAVLTREGKNGTEYLLIHRRRRDDWSLPKGKVDPGEHIASAAVREVREETGFAVTLGMPLPTREYLYRGVPKMVFYWHSSVVGGSFTPNDEVDEIAWLPLTKAIKRLTYDHDAEVLSAAHKAVPTSPLIVLRHTQAMKRAEWKISNDSLAGNDASRPLTAVGRMQAHGLIEALAAFGVSAIHSSDSRRCRDTVGPYASARSLALELEMTLSEERHTENPKNARKQVRLISRKNGPLVLCTHRPVMPTVMQTLAEEFELADDFEDAFDPALVPGAYVVYHRDATNPSRIVGVERHRGTD